VYEKSYGVGKRNRMGSTRKAPVRGRGSGAFFRCPSEEEKKNPPTSLNGPTQEALMYVLKENGLTERGTTKEF